MVPVTYRYLTCNEIHNLLDNASYCLLGLLEVQVLQVEALVLRVGLEM